MARESPPDLVILDWMLEGVSGIEVCRRLRRMPETANVPIIMLTARGEESDRIRGFETGADDYVTKPFSPRELVARVTAVLRRVRPALAGERLLYADLEMDVVGHKVKRGGAPRRARPDRVPAAAPFPRTSRPGLLARAAARFGLGPGQRDRAAHRRRPHPAAAQGDQRRRQGRHHPHRPLGRLRARHRSRLAGRGIARRGIEPGEKLAVAGVVTVMDVATVGRIEPGALRHLLDDHPIEIVVAERQDRAVALAQARSVAGGVVIIFLVVARVGNARGSALVRRSRPGAGEEPAPLPVVAVISERGAVEIGVDDPEAPAVRAVGIGGVGLLERRADAAPDLE